MYIPFSYVGQVETCVSASGGDDITVFTQGPYTYRMHAFTTPGNHTYTIHSGSAAHRLVVIGAGGGGGLSVDGLPRSSGGGGAGGFLFLDNLPMGAGTYDIYVGSGSESIITPNGYAPASCTPLTFDLPTAYNGQTSSFEYTFTPTQDGGYYVPNQRLTAFGGGRGSNIWRTCAADGTSKSEKGQDGSSGGGGSVWGDGSGPTKTIDGGDALYNTTGLSPHGFDGGQIIGTTQNGTGGGGAASTGSANTAAGAPAGGDGVNLNDYIGINQTVCVGGRGGDANGSHVGGSITSGSGGSSAKDNDTADEIAETKGQDGMVLVLYRICTPELSKCKTYAVDGGVSGGTVTYIPCGGGELVSSSIDFDQQAVICTYTSSEYPQSTGTVTLTITGSCDEEIPIQSVPTCDTGSGEVTTPTYIYDYDIDTICYPTPESCQRQYTLTSTITYTDREGNAVTQSEGGGFVPNTGVICAREEPTPTITNGTLTQTATVCGYYCSSSV